MKDSIESRKEIAISVCMMESHHFQMSIRIFNLIFHLIIKKFKKLHSSFRHTCIFLPNLVALHAKVFSEQRTHTQRDRWTEEHLSLLLEIRRNDYWLWKYHFKFVKCKKLLQIYQFLSPLLHLNFYYYS